MSFQRFVYYSGVAGGWAGLLAALFGEPLLRLLGPGPLATMLVGALTGALIGGLLQVVAGRTNPQWREQLRRMPRGLLVGAVAGGAGGLLGELLFAALGLPRALGWTVMGLGIGSAEGLYEASRRKLRNGLLGGALGGLIGGALFDPIVAATASQSGLAGRAAALAILGVAIGTMIGLAQVVLKEAWLTVVDGFGAGRQLILSGQRTVLGRGDHLPLPLLGYAGRDLESEHAAVTRAADGRFFLEDNGSQLGTLLNGRRIERPEPLEDGDRIRLGTNIIRFRLSRGRGAADDHPTGAPRGPNAGQISAPPPPPGGPQPDASAESETGATPRSSPPPLPKRPPRISPGAASPDQASNEPPARRPGISPDSVPPGQARPRPPSPGESPRIPPPPPPPPK